MQRGHWLIGLDLCTTWRSQLEQTISAHTLQPTNPGPADTPGRPAPAVGTRHDAEGARRATQMSRRLHSVTDVQP